MTYTIVVTVRGRLMFRNIVCTVYIEIQFNSFIYIKDSCPIVSDSGSRQGPRREGRARVGAVSEVRAFNLNNGRFRYP